MLPRIASTSLRCLTTSSGHHSPLYTLSLLPSSHIAADSYHRLTLHVPFMSTQPPTKKMKKNVTIGTHNGAFHCDEALACWMLKKLPCYKDAKIIRTRDKNLLNNCDVVVDVGAVYDVNKNRFDHHQLGFDEHFSTAFSTKLSSAGLVYKHFGAEIIRTLIPSEVSNDKVDILFNKIYKSFIEGIDGIDNGVSQYFCPGTDQECSKRYSITTDLSSRVSRLNQSWQSNLDDDAIMTLFEKAMALVGNEFNSVIMFYANDWLPAQQLVMNAIDARAKCDSSEQIILFNQALPWKEHLFTIEKSINPKKPFLFVLYPDQSKNWRIQAISAESGSFHSRKALPDAWRGLRDSELSTVTGIPDCIFVHATGFIGGNKTYEGALKMAQQSVVA